MSNLLYSTNVYLKYWVQETYFNGVHFVWCSELFNNPPGQMLPPSANPSDIYRRLKDDIAGRDIHSIKIIQQRALLTSLATKLPESAKEEIIYKVMHAAWEDWKPLIYVFPRALVEARLTLVPISQRASDANEYVITDLRRHEFDVLEVWP